MHARARAGHEARGTDLIACANVPGCCSLQLILIMATLFDRCRDTGLQLQALLLEHRANAEQAGNQPLADELTRRFRNVNTHTRQLNPDDIPAIHTTITTWQHQIQELLNPETHV